MLLLLGREGARVVNLDKTISLILIRAFNRSFYLSVHSCDYIKVFLHMRHHLSIELFFFISVLFIHLLLLIILFTCNGTRTHNHLVRKRTLKHLSKAFIDIQATIECGFTLKTCTWHDKNIQSIYHLLIYLLIYLFIPSLFIYVFLKCRYTH